MKIFIFHRTERFLYVNNIYTIFMQLGNNRYLNYLINTNVLILIMVPFLTNKRINKYSYFVFKQSNKYILDSKFVKNKSSMNSKKKQKNTLLF